MKDVIFFHRQNDYTGSTRVLANVITDEYAHIANVKIVTQNSGSGFLSDLKNVEIIEIPSVSTRIPYLSSFVVDLTFIFYATYYSTKYKTFYINTILPYVVLIMGFCLRRNLICHVHESHIIPSLRIRIAKWWVEHIPCTIIFVSNYLAGRYNISKKSNSKIQYNRLSKVFLSKISRQSPYPVMRNIILMVSSLTEAKGILNFIELAKLMPECNFELLLSSKQDEINLYFVDKYIPDNCKLFSATNDVHPFFRRANIVINLSIPELCVETFGLTILEAMPYGIPAIVPNVGGIIELVDEGVSGYIVDVTNLDIVKDRIEDILSESRYAIFSQNTIDVYNNKFN